ncbi:dephospho-CoA kinase [Enterococcus durans]|uniref:Dephospho-CoA kinase n=1 Tax=Enterococcus durans TaxID=53345 RepID=A0A367CDU4_9ENTE|nr:dephospho-CoA kinase [Enterococcus durans]RCA10801.1 dephospho-CoA kinase [Enterococcus durans]
MSKLPKTENKIGFVLGLTGGIATGKSTAAAIFSNHGIPIVDGDIIAREVVAPKSEGLLALVSVFGDVILQKNGTLDRKALGQIVFNSAEERKKMDRLLDPFIRTAITEKIEQLKTEYPLVVADIPLLYEGHYEQLMDAVAVVYLPENIQIRRLMKRNHLSLEEAKQRVSSQLSIEEKKALADIVFDNSGSKEMLEAQIKNWLAESRNRFL